jgi:hypothetical protein
MAELEEMIAAKDEELRQAKEAAWTSTRTEALAEFKNCLGLLDEIGEEVRRATTKAQREAAEAKRAAVRSRIKTRLPVIVESIWVRVQYIDKRRCYVHVRLYLHGGEPRYFLVSCGEVTGHEPWPLRDADFRAGDVGGDAIAAKQRPQLPAEALAG